ncbi:MAG: YfhO family protein, partial [Eubacteriales bacterium]|nr:YfhO family protein [Eubacteriales bacterium]
MGSREQRGRAYRCALRCLAVGALSAAILWAAFMHEGIDPFGENSLAVTDASVQYLDLFAYYRDVLTGQNTIGATFSYMLGTGMAGVFAYYLASPLNLLVLLFPKEQMSLFLTVLVTLKIS